MEPGIRRSIENATVVVALGIAVFMLSPVSPVLSGSGPARTEAEAIADDPPKKARATRPERVAAKGILMTGYTAGGPRFEELLRLIRDTELNAVVIDIKDERGEVSWRPATPQARAMGAGRPKLTDPRATIGRLHREGVYVIGRIVTFQDSFVAAVRPDIAVQDRRGGVWRNEKGLGWADPYSVEAQDYNLALAKEAVDLGFDEIQFDYVRFPSDGDTGRMWFRHRDARPMTEVIRAFLSRARGVVTPAYLSAAPFGLVTLARDDLGIGQRLDLIAREVDYVSLMLYPSHYNKPEYDIADPERDPYKTIAVSVRDAKTRIAGTRTRLRPWIQDFSLRVRYTPVEVRAQIQALEDNGVNEFLLWNARNVYTEDALRPAVPGASRVT